MEENKLKKIVEIIAIICLIIIITLNLLYTTELNMSEETKIYNNSMIYVIGLIIFTLFMFCITKIINNYLYKEDTQKNIKIRKNLFIGSVVIYSIFSIIWTIVVNPKIIADQVHVSNLAQVFYRKNEKELLSNHIINKFHWHLYIVFFLE